MGANSAIEWTHHTFNIVWGCQRVSPGCQHCYAETLAKRYGHNVWGPAKTTERREMSAAYWRQPYKWEREAKASGQRARVFCGSMSDVFEDHPTNNWARANLFGLIEETPHLDWLLLTKRPENIDRMLPIDWLRRARNNVWFGTSVEDQQRADERIPHLLNVPAKVRFLSCEPLLGPVDLSEWLDPGYETGGPQGWQGTPVGIHWVIAGGESGHGARPMHPAWARSLRDQCQAAGVAFFMKQWGEYTPYYEQADPESGQLRLAEFTKGMQRVGKARAGRLLDGRTWDELPGQVLVKG